MSHRHLFLDLDGTLTDSRPGITRCLAHALEGLGRPVPPDDKLVRFIGPPLRETLVHLLGDEALAARAQALYRERFATHGLYENAVYDGVPDLLERLVRGGWRLHLATSKPEVFARRILEHFALARYFRSVFGAGLDGSLGDKPALLAHALAATGAQAARSVMVGDRRHDVVGAHANGLASVGVLYGYGSRSELIDAGVGRVVETPCELAHVLEDWPA